MAKLPLEKEKLEIVLGVFLMFLSFLLTFLTVIKVVEPNIALMFLFYSMSLTGLIVGLHGLYTLILTKRPSEEQ
jgi:hypothetical protein